MLDWSLPGGQDHYFKAISELTASDFSGEKVAEINKRFDTNILAAARIAYCEAIETRRHWRHEA